MNIPALEVPNCGTKCPLNKWQELYKHILPTKSYEEECELRDGEPLPISGNPEFVRITDNVRSKLRVMCIDPLQIEASDESFTMFKLIVENSFYS